MQYDFPDGAYILVSRGDEIVQIHAVETGATTIGRGINCTLILVDPLVSRLHAVIWLEGNELLIRDESSRNGTRLNGQTVNHARIDAGGVAEIGPYTLRFFSDCSEALKATNSGEITTRSENPDSRRGPAKERLTPRQQRVYQAFLRGLSEKEVARQMGISIHTVHSHAKEIYKTFAVCSRAELLTQTPSNDGIIANDLRSTIEPTDE